MLYFVAFKILSTHTIKLNINHKSAKNRYVLQRIVLNLSLNFQTLVMSHKIVETTINITCNNADFQCLAKHFRALCMIFQRIRK